MAIDARRFWEEVRLGEDTGLELKEARFRGQQVSAPHRDGLADGLAAFANSGGGRLVLGVTNDREPQSLEPERLNALASLVTEVCSDSVEPPLEFSLYRVPASSPGGGGVLLVEVPAGDTVHRSPGGYFRRRGDSKRQMLPDEIRRLLPSRGQSDAAATDTQVVGNTGVNSLRPELWQRYASSRTNDPAETTLTNLVLPAASPPLPDGIAARVKILHDETGEPLQGIHVLLIYPNRTCLEGRTDAFGHADFELYARLPVTVLCAAPGYRARVVNDYLPDEPLELRMKPAADGGSFIIANRSGHLPGIRGRLTPMLDSLDRTYLSADNVAINDGLQQPVQFRIDEAVRLTDSMGASATLWFREMRGSSSVFDYRYTSGQRERNA